ncbi:MAG: septum site-determining protein MinC [Chloroflexota bacterium]|jgi:septum site-determining protein MinC
MLRVKGIRDGLLITFEDDEQSWQAKCDALLQHLDAQIEFLKGAKLALDVGSLAIKAADLGSLRDQISERGLSLWAVVSNSPVTEQTAQMLGMATRLHTTTPERSGRQADSSMQGEDAIFVRRTLRSGNRLQHNGHVIIIGDVNPGAEIIAGGDVVVWGKLRGTVHAGAQGNENAIVCALELSPTQLRIADQVATTPQGHSASKPEIACLKDGQVLAEIWNPAGSGKE